MTASTINAPSVILSFCLACLGLSCGSSEEPEVSPSASSYPSPLTFAWDPPQTGTVDYYLVLVSREDGPFEIAAPFVYQRRYSFQPCEGCSYRVQVQAYNIAGGGPLSDPSDRVLVYRGKAVIDSDDNRMPDVWRTPPGLDPHEGRSPAADGDADGTIGLQDYLGEAGPMSP